MNFVCSFKPDSETSMCLSGLVRGKRLLGPHQMTFRFTLYSTWCVVSMSDVFNPELTLITRDSAVDALPGPCLDRRKLKSRKAHK